MITQQTLNWDHDTRNGLRFFGEAVGAVAALAVTTIVAHRLQLPPGTFLFTVVQLAPVPAAWLLPLVFLRHYRRVDELQRLQVLQSIALTAGILAGASWSWPALRHAFNLQDPAAGMWEVYFSVLFVVISALVTKMRAMPRAR